MGRYYYRPIPSGYADVGRSIAAGITGGVGSYYAGKEATRTRGIEDEERARRREREDLDLDVMLASAGGGRGVAPGAPSIGRPEVGSALNDRRGISAAPGPDRSRRFTQMGDFYIEDPASRATRLEAGEFERTLGREAAGFELEQGRAATERTRRGETLGAAGLALTGGGGTEADYEAFYGEKMDPLAAVRAGRPQAPVRGTQAYMDMLEDEADIAQRYRGQADEDELPEIGSIEFNRAFDIVESMARERNPEGYTVGSLTNAQRAQLIETTRALLRGEDPFGDDVAGLLQRSIDAQSFPGIAAPAAALVGGRAGITDEDVLSIMQANPEASDEEIVELVRQRR